MILVDRGWARRSKLLSRDKLVIMFKRLKRKRSIRSLADEYKVSWSTMDKFITKNDL